jgi:hypothetical protein
LLDPNVSMKIKGQLIRKHSQLNPLLLKKRIDILIEQIFKLNRLLREQNSDI